MTSRRCVIAKTDFTKKHLNTTTTRKRHKNRLYHIQSRSRDLNLGPPGTKQPLYHLSYHPLTIFMNIVCAGTLGKCLECAARIYMDLVSIPPK